MLPFIAYRMYIARRLRQTRQRTENLKRTTELVKAIDTKAIVENAFKDFDPFAKGLGQ